MRLSGGRYSNYLKLREPEVAPPIEEVNHQYLHFPFSQSAPDAWISATEYTQSADVTGSLYSSANKVSPYSFNQGVGYQLRIDNVDLGRRFTLCIWALSYNTSGFSRGLIGVAPNFSMMASDNYSIRWHFNQDTHASGYWQNRLRYNVSGSFSSTAENFNTSLGSWFHLAIVVDLDSGSCRHYYNGNDDMATAVISSDLYPITGSLFISQMADTYNPYSYLDDVQVYTTALGDVDIEYIYQNPGQMTTSSIA